jgi:epoxyqueuosine reductase
VCQDVCPFNASQSPKPRAPELAPRAALSQIDLVGLLELGAAGYRRLVRRTTLRRVTAATLARNAAVALGNSGDARARDPLLRALGAHKSALVRGHVAWALGRLGPLSEPGGRDALRHAAEHDPDGGVRDEAQAALESLAAR